jgi:hypothetical protein
MAQSVKSLGRGKVLTVKEIDHPQLIRFNGRRFARYVRLHSGLLISEMGVRRDKAALSGGCKSHPATAPAGSNRSSHGGDEMAEAFGVAGHV